MAKKKEYKVEIERLSRIDKLIKELNYPSSTKLGEILEVHPVTIRNDVSFMRDRYNAPIEYDRHKHGYYYADKTFRMKDVLLTESEIFAITTIVPLMEQYKNTPLESSFKSVFEKISEMLPSDQITYNSSYIENMQVIPEPTPRINQEIFTKIFKAIREKRSISFEYKSSKSKEYKLHGINPYKVICHKASWYVIGFSHKHQEFRIFSLSRFKNCDIVQPFTPVENYEDFIHIDQFFGVWNNETEPMNIELLFSSERGSFISEREWYPDQECHQNEDGTVFLSFKTNQEQEITSWILSFGSDVKVLNPPELKEKIKNEILKAAKKVKDR